MKYKARTSKKAQLDADMRKLNAVNLTLFESDIVLKKESVEHEAKNYGESLAVLDEIIKTLNAVCENADVKNDLSHAYKEIRRYIEHLQRVTDYEELYDYSEKDKPANEENPNIPWQFYEEEIPKIEPVFFEE